MKEARKGVRLMKGRGSGGGGESECLSDEERERTREGRESCLVWEWRERVLSRVRGQGGESARVLRGVLARLSAVVSGPPR